MKQLIFVVKNETRGVDSGEKDTLFDLFGTMNAKFDDSRLDNNDQIEIGLIVAK